MNPWTLLAISICLEIVATNLLKVSDGFTKLLPTVGSLMLYAISFYFVGQKIDTAGLIGMALIICGVLVINLFSQTGH